jgi:hypothetical protein
MSRTFRCLRLCPEQISKVIKYEFNSEQLDVLICFSVTAPQNCSVHF